MKKIYNQKCKLTSAALVFCFVMAWSNIFSQATIESFRTFTTENAPIADPSPQKIQESTNRDGSEQVLSPPPANDGYCSAFNAANTLTANAPCKLGSVNTATTQVGETNGCASGNCGSVWYSFTATQASMYISVGSTNPAAGTANPCNRANGMWNIVVYPVTAALVASCPAGSSIPSGVIGCHVAGTFTGTQTIGSEFFSNLSMNALTIGATYIVQVMQSNCLCAAATRNFCIDLGTPHNCATCASTCGPICAWNLPNPGPTVNQVIATCPIYAQQPPLNPGDTHTDCYTFTAPNTYFNVWGIVDGWGCVTGTDFSDTFQIFNANCAGGVIGSGSGFGGYTSGYVAGHQYVICYTHQAACPQDTLWPYVWAASSLPIELLSFDAKANKNDVDVFWTTASEINTSEFVIQRTRNGQDFVDIGKIKAAGNSTTVINYKVKDSKPLEGNNYYRLKEVDIDGKENIGKLVATRFDRMESEIAVIPNPAHDEINMRLSSSKGSEMQVYIIDTKGSIVLSKNVTTDSEGVNFITLNVLGLPNGVYSVHAVSDDRNLNTRFVKQ